MRIAAESTSDTHSSGDIMSRLTNDVDNVSNTLSQSVTQLFSGVINVVGTLVAMIMLSPLLTLISMLTMPLMFLVTRIIARFSRRFFREQQKNLGAINGYIEEMVSGQKVIKLFSREEENKRDFAGLNANLRRSGTKAEVVAGVMGPFMNMISNITYLIVAVAGGWLAIRSANGLGGTVTIGIVFSFLLYMKNFAVRFRKLPTCSTPSSRRWPVRSASSRSWMSSRRRMMRVQRTCRMWKATSTWKT